MNNIFFLAIQGSYSVLEVALYKNFTCLTKIVQDNFKASSTLIPIIQDLLHKNNLDLSDLSFIAVDQGPGAFTSLRVTISTVNGLAFASKIPLIGIDGLEALAAQAANELKNTQDQDLLITLLNAYNNDVYYKINNIYPNNYTKINLLLTNIKENFLNKKIIFTGNGALLHKDLILKELKESSQDIFFLDIANANTEQIAKMAKNIWENDKSKLSFKLEPLYLKSQNFAIQSKK
ncbi:MAG: Peptidase M22 glycoprotease [candidate division TM6 bacterium GW2011_GWF2_28_16]|jgi:tRNA threonylcarbamoyladenosine biosynthesis protein TsaB|nr:MAG: Peptidase M22 glycoprotease [candidate division TM6 bacterium GW2011_GWF2_28_16]